MDQIQKIKKYDLHCHLDGSLSAVIIKKLAAAAGLKIPRGEALLRQIQVSGDCTSLKEYLEKFELPLSCLITAENFKTAVIDVLGEAAQENIVYMEIRFAPLLSVREQLSCREIIESSIDGVREAEKRFGVKSNLILCGMRHMPPEENAALVKTAREYLGNGVCAVDLAGDEAAFPVMKQAQMFHVAKQLGIPFTIHAGECGSSRSVRDAIELGADRIGHGIAAKNDKELVQYCASKKIPFEMCPTSNFQTKAVTTPEEYPFMEFLDAGIPVTINTDNRSVSNTTITKELQWLQEQYHITYGDMELLMRNAAEASFFRE